MKKIKLIIILLLVIIFTGCEAEYEIKINKNKITDSISINTLEIDPEFDVNSIQNVYALYNSEEKEMYNLKNENGFLNYSFGYTDKNFKNASFINGCVENFEFNYDGEKYNLKANGLFKCLPYQVNDFQVYPYDKLTVKINTNNDVIDHNADLVKGNSYYWYITPENRMDIDINMSYKINNTMDLIIFCGIIIAIGILVYVILFSRNKKNNQI